MAADLHIHVLTDTFTSEHYKAFQSTWGKAEFEKAHNCDLFLLCADTPNVWVGEVSWLKAAFLENNEKYIPTSIQAISDIVGEDFPVIDDVLIEKINKAMQKKNTTSYRLASGKEIADFLKDHEDEQVFTISW